MKRLPTLSAALLLASLAAVPALAGNSASLQNDLDLRQFDVDVSTLTEAQKAQINAALHSSDSAAEKHSVIYSIVN